MLSLDHKSSKGQAPYGRIHVAGMVCYFSYDTIVAVRIHDGELYYIANEWGPTTGKHINAMFSRTYGKEVEELETIINEQLIKFGLDYVRRRIHGKEEN